MASLYSVDGWLTVQQRHPLMANHLRILVPHQASKLPEVQHMMIVSSSIHHNSSTVSMNYAGMCLACLCKDSVDASTPWSGLQSSCDMLLMKSPLALSAERVLSHDTSDMMELMKPCIYDSSSDGEHPINIICPRKDAA